jgi:hypothetical protein
MAVVAGAAVGLWMIAVVYRVQAATHKEDLFHLWVRKDLLMPKDRPEGLRRSFLGTTCCSPFWPRYWRKLLGQPWPGTYRCSCCEAPQYTINGATKQLYSYIGTRPGICYGDQSRRQRRTWEEMEPWHSLIDEYQKEHEDRPYP